MRSAYGYVELDEQKNGLIPNPVDNSYIWGSALTVLDAAAAGFIEAHEEREDGR